MSVLGPILAAIPSILGMFSGNQQQSRSSAAQDELMGKQGRALDYQMARQALVDPLFKEMLQRALIRTRNAPSFGGLRAPAFGALRRPVNQLPALPTPQLIGSEPAAPAGAGGATVGGGGNTMFNQFLAQER